mgnify:FL=1
MADSLPDIAVVLTFAHHFLCLLDASVDVVHQESGYSEWVLRLDVLDVGEVGEEDARTHTYHFCFFGLAFQLLLLFLIVTDVKRICVQPLWYVE